ncbi:hypothetical protein PINS_up007515 [Pythium insidiosum]|nr:hypothetical protein PINS_up007515 [Pythium insidiosum]
MPYGSVEAFEWRREQRRYRCIFRRRHRQRCSQLCSDLCILAGFHMENALFVLSSLLLLMALVLAIALLPLCGLGVVVLRLLFRSGAVNAAVCCDVEVAETLAALNEQIGMNSTASSDEQQSPYRRVSGLDSLSVESLTVLLYLVTIKILLGALSFVVAQAAMLTPTWILLALRALWVGGSSYWWETLCSFLVIALVFVVACMSMDVVARLSIATTRFFCCEPVPSTPLCPRAISTRSNVVVVRLVPAI